MSSFKRRLSGKQPESLPPGTRSSLSSISTLIVSTGIPSLDDILGGGLPLSCSLLILAPDCHTAYSELVQKYSIAQGLSSGHRLWVIDDDAQGILKSCMWMPNRGSDAAPSMQSLERDDNDEEKSDQTDEKIKIAWRYEQMKKFQTTVTHTSPSMTEYCRAFDLTCRIPNSVLEESLHSRFLTYIAVSDNEMEEISTLRILRQITERLNTEGASASSALPLRICIPSLGSPQWGDLTSQHILRFMHSLRAIVRTHPHVCVSTSLSANLSADVWGGSGWTQKLGWLSDAAITLSAFIANPALLLQFPAHHGFLHVHTLPSPHTLLPPSDKFSTLRGLSSSGENNLAFKCTRKRLVFETLHLDLEGGVGERRTTHPTNAVALDAGVSLYGAGDDGHTIGRKDPSAAVTVEVQQSEPTQLNEEGGDKNKVIPAKPKKPKKTVAFRSDKPDLYDF